ncbi:glycosyltransferase, partial [candidate division WOR-3 bacterium]|nr:glycosyltransferase [candidate division WOR-3 bacterium]MBD3365427.1 glycosyltransferase [candidate division WOR-3 bacterium]
FIALTNSRAFRRLGNYPEPTRLPRISVLVPARNEAKNIQACVESLLNQNYPDFEVVVLDDESTDDTWERLKRLRKKDNRLKIIKGKSLPEGWIGKHWACHQLSQKARGELYLFTDADTRHHPSTLQDAVAAFEAENADFMTALPREEAETFGEKLTIPIMSFGIISFLPVGIAHRSHSPLLSLTVGQFMMIRADTYEEIGGHESVKQDVLDDVSLGRRVKAHRLNWRIVDACNHINCRMYNNIQEVSDGFSKNLFATFGNSVFIYIPVWLWLTAVFIFPVFVIGLAVAGGNVSETCLLLALVTIGFSLILWSITHLRFRYPLYLTLLYPVMVFLWVVMAMRSMVLSLAGQTFWKGRNLDLDTDLIEDIDDEEAEVRDRTV